MHAQTVYTVPGTPSDFFLERLGMRLTCTHLSQITCTVSPPATVSEFTNLSGRCCKAMSGSNHFYECPGYEASFPATLEQRAEIAISLFRQF